MKKILIAIVLGILLYIGLLALTIYSEDQQKKEFWKNKMGNGDWLRIICDKYKIADVHKCLEFIESEHKAGRF